jgi:hypothetical protein
MAESGFATEATLFSECVALAKNSILTRLVVPCYEDEAVDLVRLRESLAHYKPTDVSGRGALSKSFSTFMRQVEHAVVVHLAARLGDEHSNLDMLGSMLEELDVAEPLQGAAPFVHVEVAPRPPVPKDGKVTLTSFDSLREQTQLKLVLVPDKEGRLVNPNTSTIWLKGSNGHFVCVGHKDARGNSTPLTPEDVRFCAQNKLAYDPAKVQATAAPKKEATSQDDEDDYTAA